VFAAAGVNAGDVGAVAAQVSIGTRAPLTKSWKARMRAQRKVRCGAMPESIATEKPLLEVPIGGALPVPLPPGRRIARLVCRRAREHSVQ
jgi:hypothetical protein